MGSLLSSCPRDSSSVCSGPRCRQDDDHQRDRRPGIDHRADRSRCSATTLCTTGARARGMVGLAPQEYNFDRYLNIRDVLIFQAGYYGLRGPAVAKPGRPAARAVRSGLQGQAGLHQAVGRDEAPAHAGARADPPAAAGDPRRADRRRRRRAGWSCGRCCASSTSTGPQSSSRRITSRKPRSCATASGSPSRQARRARDDR